MAKTKQEKFKSRRYLVFLSDEDSMGQELYEFVKGRPVKILKEEYKELYGRKLVEIDAIENTKLDYPEPIMVFVVE